MEGGKAPGMKPGDCVVAVDPRYFHPAEVETLLGDPAKAKAELGWEPEITAQQMCADLSPSTCWYWRRRGWGASTRTTPARQTSSSTTWRHKATSSRPRIIFVVLPSRGEKGVEQIIFSSRRS
jgi:hypothetical protein